MTNLKPIWWGIAGLLVVAVVVFALVTDSQSDDQSKLMVQQADTTTYPLTVRLYNKQNREALVDVQMMATEQVVTNRSPVSQTVRSSSNGAVIFYVPQGYYLIKPVEQTEYLGTSTVEVRGATTIDLDLATRPEQLTEEDSQ